MPSDRSINSEVMFIRNTWYVIAWDYELADGRLLSRTVSGEPILLYRAADQRIIALADRCAHRLAPLSLGRREGDCIRCMYHGLKFDTDGRCVEIPGQQTIPPQMKVRRYPTVERNRWVWIWLGAKDDADASLIPNCFSLDDPGWAYKPGYFRYDASHRLIIDNLLDFSHLAYVHPTTLGGTETATRSKVSRNGSGVRIERWLLGDEPAPFHTKIQAFDGKVDRWWFYDFLLPGVLVMHSGVQAENTGAQDGQHAGALEFRSCQAVTPETRRSSHYFFAVPRNFALNDGRVNESIYENIVCAFDEDRRIIEAQQQRIDLDPLARMVPIGADAALNHFRALADKQLAAEADAGLRAARA